MSRSRSLSYCSLSYSWRLIRFTRRRRRSGTAWGLEKAHTHTHVHVHAHTHTHAQIRHARADNEKGIQMHTCTHRHNWTQRKTDLNFYLTINITEWQLDQRRKLRKNKQTTELNSCTSLLTMFWSVWLSVKVISCWDAAHVPDEGWTDQNTGIE